MARKQSLLDVPVAFGNVSVGDKTARIGVQIDRQHLGIDKADEFLCGRRLTGTIKATAPDEGADQQHLDGFEPQTLSQVFDVKQFSVTPSHVATGLTFAIEEIDVGVLAQFAKRSGRLTIKDVESLEADEAEQNEEAFAGNGAVE